MSRGKSKHVRAVLLVGALGAVLGSVGLTWRGHIANDRWQAALAEVRVVEARLDAIGGSRLALWGETTDEHAEPHYDRALALVAGWEIDRVLAAVHAEDDEARILRATLIAEGTEALDALHRGAHAAHAIRTVDWSLGFELPMRKLMCARFLTLLSEMQATSLLEEGRELEAVGVLLDALQFAGDLSQGPIQIEEMIGLALLAPDMLIEGVADGSLRELSGAAEERLVAGVRALDRRLGWRMTSLEGELVLATRGLENLLADADAWQGVSTSWEGGVLGLTRDRLLSTDHVRTVQRICARFERAFAAGPNELFDEIERHVGEAETPENPITAIALPQLDSAYRLRLFSLGRFRLLVHALTGADPPADPWLAEFLRTEETETGTCLRLDHEVFGRLEVHAAR